MNDLNIDYINDILSTSVISHKNLIGETLFVNSNPAKVESVEVKKVDNILIIIENYKFLMWCCIHIHMQVYYYNIILPMI